MRLLYYKIPLRRKGDARGLYSFLLHPRAFARILTVKHAAILLCREGPDMNYVDAIVAYLVLLLPFAHI